MMTIKNVNSILELAELLNSAATFTEAELTGRITQPNGHPWTEIWVPQPLIDAATEEGKSSLYELGLALVRSDLGCIDKIRVDRDGMHGFVYTLYQLPSQGYSAQQQGGIRYMGNIEEFSEFFDDDDSGDEYNEPDDYYEEVGDYYATLLDRMEEVQEGLAPSADSEAVEITTPKGVFNGLAIDDGRSPLEICVPGANTYSLVIDKGYWPNWARLHKELPTNLNSDERVYPFVTWDSIPFDEKGVLPIEGHALHYDGYGRVGSDD